MDIYAFLEVLAIVLGVVAVFGSIGFCIGVWQISRETHIEPMKFEPKRTQRVTKIDISVAYQGAKVGQVLSARK